MTSFQYSGSPFFKKLFTRVATIFLLLATSVTPVFAKTDTTAFVGVNVVPMTDDKVLLDQTVIVKAGSIKAMGPRGEVAIPANTKIIKSDGSWLMPGLIDTHVHLLNIREDLDLFVANGVTSIRALDGRAIYLKWANDITKGKRLGPTFLTTGPMITNMNDDGKIQRRQFTTAEQARAEVKRQWVAGYRSIKPYTDINAVTYKSAVAEAQKLGMYVTGHVPDSVGLEGVIAAGQKEIAHTEELRSALIANYDPQKMFALYPLDRARIQPVVDLLKKNNVAVVTSLSTLQVMYDATLDIKSVLQRPEIAYQPDYATAMMQAPDYSYANRLPARYLGDVVLPFYKTVIRALEDAKVPLLMGTDSGGIPSVVPGWGTHNELDLLVEAGLSPYEALKTATVTPSQIIPGLGDRGVVRVGARADLILLSANPFTKVSNTRSIIGVMVNGQWIDDAKRKAMLAAAKVVISKTKPE
jgi:imidazolonepropionase-like amidohydrolase